MSFPVDDTTLDIIWMSVNPPADSERTSLTDALDLLSEMAGADPDEVDGDGVQVGPWWHPNEVISALISEVRRLRLVQHFDGPVSDP